MNPRPVVPHLSWTGPQPENEFEAYALAILVRIAETGDDNKGARNPDLPPCSFTTKTLRVVAMMWAYCRRRIRDDEIKDYKSLLSAIQETDHIDMKSWVKDNGALVEKATADLLEYVETDQTPGFRVYG